MRPLVDPQRFIDSLGRAERRQEEWFVDAVSWAAAAFF